MHLGLIGLPRAGKKTVFSLLTDHCAATAPSRDGLTRAMAPVRDPRIDRLTAMYKPRRTKYAEFEVLLPPDVHPAAARDARWIEPFRLSDALLHVVRAYPDHTGGADEADPARDANLLRTELLLADLMLVETRLERIAKDRTRPHTKTNPLEKPLLERFRDQLENDRPLRTLDLTETEMAAVRSLRFLTLKPEVVAMNAGEDLREAGQRWEATTDEWQTQGARTVWLSAALEEEIRELPEADRAPFMQDLGLEEPAAHRLSRAVFEALGLISFFTVGDDEVRAWPLRRDATALEAAGRIHSDLERGFIRADTIAYDDLIGAGTEKEAREQNLHRLNGKTYRVRDGDILNIRFNV